MTIVAAAARNNAEWCAAMCRTHGCGGTVTARAWASARRTPPRYPDAVTLRPDTGRADILDAVDTRPGCSVKDSFARLDLSTAGFEQIIQAQWIERPPARPTPPGPAPWTAVSTPAGLAEWAAAWDSGPADLFRPQLLAHPAIRILAARHDGAVGYGAVVYDSGSVTGVSNLFAVDGDLDTAWAGALRALPGRRLVGYATGPALAAAVRAGFAPTGPLRVWLRT